jgi:hypothetical protein
MQTTDFLPCVGSFFARWAKKEPRKKKSAILSSSFLLAPSRAQAKTKNATLRSAI